jgi:hypothetical protein
MLKKYPRTVHLPYSLGLSDDDVQNSTDEHFYGKEIIVTEKLDGENTTMYYNHIHARSLDSKNHVSRDWVKSYWASLKHNIPESFRICGENLFAKHSIYYDNLETYFYVFGIYDGDVCLSWEDTKEYCSLLGMKHVPELYSGVYDEEVIRKCFTGKSFLGGEQEGFVVRLKDSFKIEDFSTCCNKFVREHHVTTDTHWMSQAVVPNKLKD